MTGPERILRSAKRKRLYVESKWEQNDDKPVCGGANITGYHLQHSVSELQQQYDSNM